LPLPFFWIDSSTSTEPQSFGKTLLDWATLIVGLGTSIKGWIDLLKKRKIRTSTTRIDAKGDNRKFQLVIALEMFKLLPMLKAGGVAANIIRDSGSGNHIKCGQEADSLRII